ncbi:SurA N-terminal domain-containing protein [Thermaurantiacus sp.]
MLDAIRRSTRSWVGMTILGLALLALVVTLFYGQATAPTAGGRGTEVARVGAAGIGETDLVDAANRILERERESNPALTMPEFVRLGGIDMVLEQLLVGRALAQFAERSGIPISKRIIDGEIASIPALQVAGKFDESAFRRFLQQQRLSEEMLRRDIAANFAQRLLLRPVLIGTTVPDLLVEPYATLLLEERRGTIVQVPATLVPEPPPPDKAALEAFFARNRAAWTVPERRAWREALITRADFARAALPSSAEIEEYWRTHPAEFGGIERRALRQVVLPSEEEAKAFASRVAQGTAFATAAEAAGFGPADTELGIRSEAELAQELNPQVARAAFAAAQGAVSAPVRGPIGWHLMLVERVIPPSLRPLAEVRDAIAAKLAAERAEQLLAERVAAIEDRLEAGEPLGDVAAAYGLTLSAVPPTTADGRVLDSSNRLVSVQAPNVARAFAVEPDDGAQVVEDGKGNFLLLEVTDVIAPATIPLEAIRERVLANYMAEARLSAARAIADEIARRGGDLAAVARARGLPPPQQIRVRRLELAQAAQAGQSIPQPVLLLLRLPAGTAEVAPAPGGQGWYVVRTEELRRGNPKEAEQLATLTRQSLAQATANELAETFVRAVQREVGAVRTPAAIDAIKARLAGAGDVASAP